MHTLSLLAGLGLGAFLASAGFMLIIYRSARSPMSKQLQAQHAENIEALRDRNAIGREIVAALKGGK